MLGSTEAYATKWENFSIGSHQVELLTLQNFDKAVGDMVATLEARGHKDIAPELCPYFGQIWAAARGLATIVAEENQQLRGKTVLEVGCGLALPSFIAAKNGAKVSCIDLHPDVKFFMEKNLDRNGLTEAISYQELDWQRDEGSLGTFDFIFASDVLYEEHHAPALAKTIKAKLNPGGRGIFTDPCRWHHLQFIDELKKQDLQVTHEYHWLKEEGRNLKMVTIKASHI